MSALTVGSMFSGIGGLDLGLERAGMEVKYFVEKDKYAQLVLKKHWPGVPIYDDIITLRTDELPTVDIIAGGPPCQDFSVAGKRKGLEGSRGILSIVYWQKISEIRPKYVIMENVTGILDKGLLSVLGEAALCGYDAEWNTISACSVGAFHRRDRIFLIGIRSDIYDKWSERGGGGEVTSIIRDTSQCSRLQPRTYGKEQDRSAPRVRSATQKQDWTGR